MVNSLLFELPKSPVKGIHIYSSSGQKIKFGFVEIGCRAVKKRKQLKSQSELFLKYWGDKYRKKIGFTPETYRMLAYYDPSLHPKLETRNHKLDAVLFYSYISPEMLSAMNKEDKRQIYNVVSSNAKRKNLLEEILEVNDAERLHKIIIEGKNDQTTSFLRGKMAEILVQKDVSLNVSENMNFFRNSNIRYKNKIYDRGTEVDGILTFYEEEGYIQLVKNLRNLNHVKVRDRWHTNQY